MVTVLIIGQLQQHLPETTYELDVPPVATVKGLLEANDETLGVLQPLITRTQLMVTVNKKIGSLDSPIKDGDTVKLTYQANFSYEGARWHNP